MVVGIPFELRAETGSAIQPASASAPFNSPFTLEVSYGADDLSGGDPLSLALYAWNGAAWSVAPSAHDAESRTVSAELQSTGRYAILTKSVMHRIYLPALFRK